MLELPSIPEFYRGKNVFITGGSGFIGKVLLEKILRSCPDVKNIYLLLREKKGKSGGERITAITDLPLFDVVKKERPQAIKKIKAVPGDVMELSLGLTEDLKKLLIDEINIVLHVAASVKFDDPLKKAVLLNTRGTREVVNLALKMKKLDVLIHVSTTYCHTDRKVVGEELCPPHADWEQTIEIAENVDEQTLNVLTEKYIRPLPNTYTFTKSLAEHVVHDLAKGKIPAVICRPSIVISSAHEPFPGWIDNFNGPIGLLAASGKGILRTTYSDPNIISDYVPVDLLVKGIIIASWKQATHSDETERLTPVFYNGSNNDVHPTTVGDLIEMGKTICSEIPLNDVLWYPNTVVTKCYYNYFLRIVFYHLLPALFIDGILKIIGKKPMLFKLHRRIYIANMGLSYFTLNQWSFINDKGVTLKDHLLPSDVDAFSFREDEIEPLEFFKRGTMGARLYLLKEGSDLEPAKRHSQRMWYIAQAFNLLWYLGLLWLFFVKIDIISLVINKFYDCFDYSVKE